MRLGDLTPETVALALVVGLAVGLLGLGMRFGLQKLVDEFVDLGRGIFGWARDRALEPRTGAAPWACAECHSVNVASASHCYRGCGPRVDVEDLDPLGSHASAAAVRARTAPPPR